MFIRFKERTQAIANLHRGFSGFVQQVWEFDPEEVFECQDVSFGPERKVKTRPGRPGGRSRLATIHIGETKDHLIDVPEESFEVVKET